MTLLAYQGSKITGQVITFSAAAGGGDTIPARNGGILLVKNGDAGPHVVTVVVPGNDQYGNARPDITKSVAAGATCSFGPFPEDLENPSTDVINITYDGVTSVTVAAIAA